MQLLTGRGSLAGQQQMIYNEQQINNSLNYVEEQEELNQIRWELSKPAKNSYGRHQKGESEISEWITPSEQRPFQKKRTILSCLKDKGKEKEKRYTYLLELLNEATQNNFYKYEKLPSYRIQKSNEGSVSPRKIDLKLPLPKVIQQSNITMSMSQRESSLPLIKKMAVPVKLLRGDRYKDRDKETETNLQWIREHSEFLKKSQLETEDPSRKIKMLGTRRQLKSFHSFSERAPRNSFDNNRLKECITFMK